MPENNLLHALSRFNRARFFDAHEALEDVWRAVPHGPMRRHLQGLVQVAVAFHHHSTGNRVGALSVLKRALRNLDGAEASLPELDLAKLRSNLEAWREYLESSACRTPCRETDRSTIPELPRITLRK